MAIANVLLVDDEVPFVETITKRLTKRKLTVKSSFSGQEALDAMAESQDVEVVILDVKMPGMDGIETLQRLKSQFPLVEVIMLTGHATVESAIEGMKLGAFDYLMKPCDIDTLIEKVKEGVVKEVENQYKRRAVALQLDVGEVGSFEYFFSQVSNVLKVNKYIAKELAARGIRANLVAPGAIETDFTKPAFDANPHVKEMIAAQTALGRIGVPDDIGGVIAFLCSEEARWVNGRRLEVSGGISL